MGRLRKKGGGDILSFVEKWMKYFNHDGAIISYQSIKSQ